jgi:diguanylate cyclase (GGDEF)-like protein
MTERLVNYRASDLQALYQSSLRLNASLALPDVLDELVRAVLDIVNGLTSIRVFIRVEEILTCGTAWWSGSPSSVMKAHSRPDELVYRAANTAQMVSILAGKSGARAAFTSTAVPLMVETNVIGVLAFTHPGEQELPDNRQNVIRLLADQAALAVNNALLFQRISRQAYTDSLTGLPNRRAFDMRLDDETRRSSRYQHTFSLIMFDVDSFKAINDRYGHPFGDRFLQIVIGCIRKQLRETDFFARFGGDEFAIILPETDYETAYNLSRRLESVTEDCVIELSDGDRQHVSISIGLASYPRHAISASALMLAADQALYRAKEWKMSI